ncbi:class I SAM-dependent methyltransferase [Algoriphagus sp.]|uniref:O-methyltransferase n=1 Tax=Algoriphagus sp. TaxID=1872435 RepID=UPI0025FE6E49|nr:class I SAM-dependent methyltransferase [Algoriphagus sp.]
MLKKLFPLFAYLKYWVIKEDSYSLQSPLVFKIYQDLIEFIKSPNLSVGEIEDYRKTLVDSTKEIEVLDLGAGSKKVNSRKRKIADITKFSTSPKKFALLYQYFCQLTPAITVFELGTCVGITTRYLSQKTKGTLYTFEGSQEIQNVAKPNSGYENIQFILGDISETLPIILSKVKGVDFTLIDANHTYFGTLKYFELILEKVNKNSIIVIGDIHWSKEMEKAWEKIKTNPNVKMSMDFYECGVLFFDSSFIKSEYILDF